MELNWSLIFLCMMCVMVGAVVGVVTMALMAFARDDTNDDTYRLDQLGSMDLTLTRVPTGEWATFTERGTKFVGHMDKNVRTVLDWALEEEVNG